MLTRNTGIAALVLAALFLLLGSARADDIVYSNFMAGNETAQTGIESFVPAAMAFTVPANPPIDYILERIELRLLLGSGTTNLADICIRPDLDGLPDQSVVLDCVRFRLPIPHQPQPLLVGQFTGQVLLQAGEQYWVELTNPSGPDTEVTWLNNISGVEGPVARLLSGWRLVTETPAAFRVVGTAVPSEEIQSAYSAYATTGPPSPSPATVTLFPEVFCPDLTSFFCPVQVTVPPFQTSAQVCELLAQSINELPGNSPDCTADTPRPHGFSAVCSGNVLRVSNQSAGVCDGAFVCADRAEGLDSFRRAMADEHLAVDRPLRLKLIGEAEGVAEDGSVDNSVLLIHTRRCAPDFRPFTFRAEVPLAAGMLPGEIAAEMASQLSAAGDFDVTADGDKLVIRPPACGTMLSSPTGAPVPAEGNYDAAVRINDRGLGFALTPLEEPFDFLVPPPRQICTEPPSDMGGWWHFDETSGTTVHDIAFGQHGTRQNGTAQVPGFVGGGLEFDGRDDWVRIPDSNNLDFFETTDLTIDFWIKTDNAQGIETLVDKRESADSPIGYSLFLVDGRLGFQMGDRSALLSECGPDPSTFSCTNFVSSVFVADGNWHFVTLTVDRDDPNGGQWYLDGRLATRPFDPTIRDRSLANSSFLAIGRRSFEARAHFEGTLDEVEIFRRALDAEEVRKIYEAGRAGKCKNPLTVPWDTPICKDRQNTAAQATVCNASTEPARYAFEFQGLPAGQGCTVDGPTRFRTSVSFNEPLVVPGESCQTVPFTVQRPPDLVDAKATACYRVALFNLDTGEVAVRDGSIQARNSLCPIARRPTYGVQLEGITPVRFDFTEIELASPFLDVTAEVFGPGAELDRRAISLNGQPPGQRLEERLDISKNARATLELDVSLADFQPWTFYDLVVSSDLDGDGNLDPLTSTALISESAGCIDGLNQLCLNEGRFRIEVDWRTPGGESGIGQAVSLTEDAGQFWFFNPSNVELGVKVLDGRAINGHFWVFIGGLTNVEYDLVVTDTRTGVRREYSNPLGRFASIGDTTAFSDVPGAVTSTRLSTVQLSPDGTDTELHLLSEFAAYWEIAADASLDTTKTSANCVSEDTAACLQSSRFRVEVSWRDFQGNTGSGQATVLTSETGSFWFFNESNIELIAKVLDGRRVNGHFWFFYGALSNVEYTITVTDTETGEVETYFNPLGSFGSRGDISAF